MNIVVCLKQVPDTQDIKWTDKGTMIREGVESIINPFDEFALEYALKIKDRLPDTKITAISMGPMQATNLLKVAVAKGADEAILACDKKFAGADTYATSQTLAHTIKKFIPDFDLIICGQFAIDGDTAQTAPSLAGHLNVNQITFVNKIIDFDETSITLQKDTDEGFIDLKANYPLVISVLKTNEEPRPYLIKGYINSYDKEIKVVNKDDIEIDDNLVGFKGSPTYVSKSFPPHFERKSEILEGDTDEILNKLLNIIEEKKTEGK
ncbi:MAG: electron transfer flavoprotein subunit beta/FixA family protein [Candidatus Gastranaerophilales bacterium]|nr:electron transfer flavoprotein subunit beta/FixA family protein [Candidatus Gastranaerophilales bacterium]